MTKFRHIPAAGRAIIVAVAVGVLAIAVVACATSYNAIYRLVTDLDLYGYRTNQAFPLLVDLAFLVGESAAILGGIMRAVTRSEEVTRGWPFTAMLLCGAGTVAFNVWHAYLIGGRHDDLTVARCVVASLPPLLMIVSFQVLISIVKWVMLHLGRPLNSAAVLSPTGAMHGMLPGSVDPAWQPLPALGPEYEELPDGYVRHGPAWWRYADDPGNLQAPTSRNPQTGQALSKREQVERYLATLTPQQLAAATRSSVTAELRSAGVPIDESYVSQILGEVRATRNGNRAQRGSGGTRRRRSG